jgi:predicted lipid-binding transport protein (Tim44 family)
MANTQLLVIVAAAMVAAIVLFRLYTVLGRRTGNEREPRNRPFGNVGDRSDNVVALPGLRSDGTPIKPQNETEQALVDIKLADRSFEAEHFLAGAKKAHEMIVAAFAKGDRQTLRPLLNDEVFTAFDQTIKGREFRKESVRFTLVGYKDAKITHAAFKGRTAEITVSYSVQFVSSTTNAEGAVIEGDPSAVRDVTDVWTFSRDVRGSDPNWTLVATSGGEF